MQSCYKILGRLLKKTMLQKYEIQLGSNVLLIRFFVYSIFLLNAFIWNYMPIYPDEISIRVVRGGFFSDRGLIYPIYPICLSGLKELPAIFYPAAWLTSWLNYNLNPNQFRNFSTIILLLLLCLVAELVIAGKNKITAFLLASTFIGVSGSSLFYARNESFQLLNILICLGGLACRKYYKKNFIIDISFIFAIIITLLLSLYFHLQGLLFVPLAYYAVYVLLDSYWIFKNSKNFRILLFILSAVFLEEMIRSTLYFYKFECPEFNILENKINSQVENLESLSRTGLLSAISYKFYFYWDAFIYKIFYTIVYLPPFTVSGGLIGGQISKVNGLIAAYLASIVGIVAMILVTRSIVFLKSLQNSWQNRVRVSEFINLFSGTNNPTLFVPILLLVPALVLFFYDHAQAFYRVFFLHLTIIIAISISLCAVELGRFSSIVNRFSIAAGFLALLCLIINVSWILPKISPVDGYIGPSQSIHTDWDDLDEDIDVLASKCGADLTRGKIIADDKTYNSLKYYPNISQITYTIEAAFLIKRPFRETTQIFQPNYAIVRCSALKRDYESSRVQYKDLCCVNFAKENAK
jgi:hypothetical protein